MAAIVAGSRKRRPTDFLGHGEVAAAGRKRGPTAFLDDTFAFVPHLGKRGRCSTDDVADLGLTSLEFDPMDALQLIFPAADPQILRDYLQASGNVLDAAIRGFKDYLASGSVMTNTNVGTSEERPDVPANTPTNGSEWAELVVKEMSSASDLVDAKNRAYRILDLFEKSTGECSNPDKTQKMREEHKILKQMLGGLLHQNGILKRAFLIQHNRLKDYQDMVQERSQFKEIVDKYQKQIKALEDKNYALSFHLEQSKNQNSIFGHWNPDVY